MSDIDHRHSAVSKLASDSSATRWTVVVYRLDFDVDSLAATTEVVVLGPFRRRERAEARAATVRRLAAKYEDTATLHVVVEPLRGGAISAEAAMDFLYGGRV